jgi:peptidoglycan/LPS O-acetylase OafA/YrhL
MLYHGGVGWARGGFLGVDVFFVLSGFLITSLLVQEWTRTGRIALRAFWLRRARRLLPAVLLVLLAVGAYFVLLPDEQQHTFRGDALATLAYVSNWWFMVSDQSYFAQFVEPSPLRHTWSLAIEEQFYLLFPLLLVFWLGRARLGLGALRVFLLVAALASAGLMAALHDPLVDPSRSYYGTDTRMQALLLGAVLALSPRLTRPSSPLYTRVHGRLLRLPGAGLVGWLAAAGLLAMIVKARELAPGMYNGGFLLAALLSAVLIAAVTRAPRSSLGRVLSWRPMVAMGVISYGLYLWHWPVYVILTEERTGLEGPLLLGVRVLATGALAALSYRLVEEPIRAQRLQRRFTPTQWTRAVTAAMAAVVLVTLGATAAAVPPGLAPPSMSGSRPDPVADRNGRIVQAFLLGDSQSYALRMYYGNQVDGLAVDGSTQLGCGTLLAERHVDGQTLANLPACADWEEQWVAKLATINPDLVVLMLGVGELYDRRVGEEVVRFGTEGYRSWLYDEIDQRRELVRGHAGGLALATVPCMRVQSSAGSETSRIANDPDRLAWLNETIRAYTAEHPDVPLIDLYDTICADGYVESLDGVVLREDGLHLTERGAALVWERVGPALIAAADEVTRPRTTAHSR